MKQKLILKVSFLICCLILVVIIMNYSTSIRFKQGLSQFFSESGQTMKWCPEHVIDFKWLEESLTLQAKEKWSHATPKQIQEVFCSVLIEPIENRDLTKIQFKPLLLALSAEAKSALLEWSPESKMYRVQGMPFKSTRLTRELLDDPK